MVHIITLGFPQRENVECDSFSSNEEKLETNSEDLGYACMVCLRCSVLEGHKAVACRVAACESFKEQAIYWLGITNGKNI